MHSHLVVAAWAAGAAGAGSAGGLAAMPMPAVAAVAVAGCDPPASLTISVVIQLKTFQGSMII